MRRPQAASFAFKGENMKKFRIQIRAYDYHSKFEVLAEDNRESIEQSILDKLGDKSIKWESTGMYRDARRITYEE